MGGGERRNASAPGEKKGDTAAAPEQANRDMLRQGTKKGDTAATCDLGFVVVRTEARNVPLFRSPYGAVGLFADFDFHGELLGDEIAEGVGSMGAGGVLFVDLAGAGAGGVEGPGDFF